MPGTKKKGEGAKKSFDYHSNQTFTPKNKSTFSTQPLHTFGSLSVRKFPSPKESTKDMKEKIIDSFHQPKEQNNPTSTLLTKYSPLILKSRYDNM